MKKYVKKKIGKEYHTWEVEGANIYECEIEAGKLSFEDIHKCGLCNSDNLCLQTRFAQKKFKYIYIKCNACIATLNFGQKIEDPNVFYLRKNKNKEYDW